MTGNWGNRLWQFVDILALRGEEILAVQTTTRSNMALRVKKIHDAYMLPYVTKAGIQVHVHGRTKHKKRVDDKYWQCRGEVIH